jgi:hypothetical protein
MTLVASDGTVISTSGAAERQLNPAAGVVPVSFAERTASGKIKLRLADLVKVGPEGYIHGYICVRPPCGQYHEATFNSSAGTVEHGGQRIGKMRKNADGTYSMSYSPHRGDKLTARYATRADAAKSIALFHNLWALQNSPAKVGVSHDMAAAIVAMRKGDHEEAARRLDAAAKTADQQGDWVFSTHATELAQAIRDAPAPVAEAQADDALEGEAALQALREFALVPSSSYDAAAAAKGALHALSITGDTSEAARQLALASAIARKAGDSGFADKADDLIRRLNGEPKAKPDFSSRIKALHNGATYSLAEERIEAAQASLDAGDYDGAADRLDEAAMLSFGVDDLKTKEAAQKLAADIRAAPHSTPIAKVDFDSHTREVTNLLASAEEAGWTGAHTRTQLEHVLDALSRENTGSALQTLNFAEGDARYAHLDKLADRIHEEHESLKNDNQVVQDAITAAMPPGWKKDLRADPRYVKPDNGYEVQAFTKDSQLSLHPTAEKPGVPRYFTSSHDVDDFVRDTKTGYSYDPYWKQHGRSKPVGKAKIQRFRVTPIKDGRVDYGESPETRYPGEATDYGTGNADPSDPILHMPVRFSPQAAAAYDAASREKISEEVRSQFHHQDKLAPSVTRHSQATVTSAPKKTKKSATLADFAADGGSSFHGDVRLTPDIFSSANGDETDRVLAEAKDSRWWVPTDAKWSLADNVTAHELGHGVAAKAWGNGNVPSSLKFWLDFSEATGIHTIPGSDGRANGGVARETADKWISSNRYQLEKSLSEYGTTNAAEMMAELWAEYSLSSNPRAAAKLYGELAMAQMKKLDEQAARST